MIYFVNSWSLSVMCIGWILVMLFGGLIKFVIVLIKQTKKRIETKALLSSAAVVYSLAEIDIKSLEVPVSSSETQFETSHEQ